MSGIACCNLTPEPKIKKRQIENLKFETEVYNEGELNDTKVFFEDNLMCWITGNNIDEFAKDFYKVIKKYAI